MLNFARPKYVEAHFTRLLGMTFMVVFIVMLTCFRMFPALAAVSPTGSAEYAIALELT
jgi:hypothetical protein